MATNQGSDALRWRWFLGALVLPLLAFGLQRALWFAIAPYAWICFYPVVFVAPRIAGASGGLVATVISAVVVWWEFMPERGMLAKSHPQPLPLLVFLVVGAGAAALDAYVRRAERTAARAFRSLEDAERRKDQILEAVADPFALADDSGLLQYVSPQLEKLFGYGGEEMLGQTHLVLVPERHRRAVAAQWGLFVGASDPQRTLRIGRRKDGSELPIELTLSRVQTTEGALTWLSIRDVSHQQALEASARLQADRLTGALESIDGPFWILDREGNLVACNSAFHELWAKAGKRFELGTHRSAILPHLASLIAFKSEQEEAAFAARRQAARSLLRDTYDIAMNDGRTFRVTRGPTPDGGEVTLAFDLTEELRRKRELEVARAEAEHASSVKSEFLSSMSHELRTPLNAVLGFGQLLERDPEGRLSSNQREMVRDILSSGRHLLSLIEDVLDLSQLEIQGLGGESESVNVSDVVRDVARTLDPAVTSAGIELRVELGAAAWVTANRRRVLQVLLNFGSNAIKYNHRGGAVTFSVTTNARAVRVSVSDDGMGVPVEERSRLFQAFHRAGRECGPIAGTGIGLATTKRLAALMGGAVGYVNLDQGSEFWVELPTTLPSPTLVPHEP